MLALSTLAAGVMAPAQTPDVVIRLDVNPHLQLGGDGTSRFRWYDSLGKHSTVGLSMILEPGFRVLVTERLQKMPSSDNQLDEYYIEDEGNWRAGKQYLPFGRGGLLHESVNAVMAETNLLVEGLHIVGSFADGGPGRQQGVIGRIGTPIGISLAIGRHFGIDGTSFGVVRDPDNAPGRGRGHRAVFGLDVFRRVGLWRMEGELVALRNGHTGLDEDTEISDLKFTYSEAPHNSIVLGWSRDWREGRNLFRAQASILLTRSIWLEPLLRFENASFHDFGISFRARL